MGAHAPRFEIQEICCIHTPHAARSVLLLPCIASHQGSPPSSECQWPSLPYHCGAFHTLSFWLLTGYWPYVRAGYMVARTLGGAPTLADAIVEQLHRPTDKASSTRTELGPQNEQEADEMARTIWNEAIWPVERLRQRIFFNFGMEVHSLLLLESVKLHAVRIANQFAHAAAMTQPVCLLASCFSAFSASCMCQLICDTHITACLHEATSLQLIQQWLPGIPWLTC